MYLQFLLTYVILNFSIAFVANASDHGEIWIEPSVWTRHSSAEIKNEATTSCPACNNLNLDDGAILIYYKKFVSNLFKREQLQYISSNEHYQRSVLFTISAEQLELLEKSSDPRDMDAVLEDVFSKIKASPAVIRDNLGELTFLQLRHILNLLETNEVRFIMVVAATIIFTWFLHRRYNIRIVSIFLVSCFAIGFLVTYYECNQKLEKDKLAKFLDALDDSVDNQEESSFWSRFVPSYFYQSKNVKRIEIIKDSKISTALPFCRPDRVLQMYINDIFINQFQFFMEKCVSLILNFKTNLPFPLNFAAPVILITLGAFIIKLFFKYILSPKVWLGLAYISSQKNQMPKISTESLISTHVHGDRLSGDNLKLLLTALKPGISINNAVLKTSGVQEIANSNEHTEICANKEEIVNRLEKELEIALKTPNIGDEQFL